jgi:Na(+)-translocating NADH:ubiquinone oxidoreductase F subunit
MLLRIIHKYLALIVFSQLMVWLTTGFLLGQAEHNTPLTKVVSVQVDRTAVRQNLLSVENVLLRSPNARSIELINLLGNPTYKIMTQYARHADGKRYALIDAVTGDKIQLTARDIGDLVGNRFHLPSPIQDVRLVHPPIEHLPKERQPVWRVRLSDTEATHIYIRASTGDIAGVVDSNKEWTNLLMMLHFMDYENVGSFNHWWIKAFALSTLLLSITGVTWLISLLKNKQMRLSWSKENNQLTVIDYQGQNHEIKTKNNTSLLSTLQHYAFPITSVCGGGGSCGQCIVQLTQSATISVAERYRLSPEKLATGHRLACQQASDLRCDVQLVVHSKTNTVSLELLSNTFITPFIKELKFKYKGSGLVNFKPGSFVRFTIEAGESLGFPQDLPKRYQPYWPQYVSTSFSHPSVVRHYSIANRNDGSGVLTFNVKMQPASALTQNPGIGSYVLGNLQAGDHVEAADPAGGFDLPRDLSSREMVLVGGGSGIAPLKALVDELIFGEQTKAPITLFYGAKHPVELANHCWLKALETQHTNLTYCPIVSNRTSIWSGKTGHVQAPLNTFLANHRSLNRCLFFLCGPPAMMTDVTKLLLHYAIDESAIQIDSFSPPSIT